MDSLRYNIHNYTSWGICLFSSYHNIHTSNETLILISQPKKSVATPALGFAIGGAIMVGIGIGSFGGLSGGVGSLMYYMMR